MGDKVTHIPRGFMCITCKHKFRKCNHLDFTKMQTIGIFKEDGMKEVKCSDFDKENPHQEEACPVKNATTQINVKSLAHKETNMLTNISRGY